MDHYKTIIVYSSIDVGYDIIYLWKGEALDAIRNSGGRISTLSESILHYRADQEADLLDGKLSSVYQRVWIDDMAFGDDDIHISEFYVDQELAEKCFSDTKWGTFYTNAYDLDSTKPVLTQPIIIELKKDNRGRLYTNISSNPEEDGLYAKGKRFFPDHSWVDAKPGKAKVRIIREFDSYGFIVGDMIYDNLPTLAEVLDWTWNHPYINSWSTLYGLRLRNCSEPYYDDETLWIISAKGPSNNQEFIIPYFDMPGNKMNVKIIDADEFIHLYRKCSTVSYNLLHAYLMDTFGISRSEVESLFKEFKESRYYSASSTAASRPRIEWRIDTINFMPSTILSKAIELGIIHVVSSDLYHDIQCYTLDIDSLQYLCELSLDEIKKLIEEFNKTNEKIDILIDSRLKKKKIQLITNPIRPLRFT